MKLTGFLINFICCTNILMRLRFNKKKLTMSYYFNVKCGNCAINEKVQKVNQREKNREWQQHKAHCEMQ